MVAAVQPLVSGGVSKTLNIPAEATVENIESVFLEAWRMGLKSIAVYRQESKLDQPLHAADQ
jgi:ribonucleoside-diphosphate reductase alpha chain